MDTIENDDFSSQLRSLRLILGENFRPISTAAFARLTRIPLLAVRGIEAGRREVNDDDRDAIDLLLGACWSSELHQWVCTEDSTRFFSRMEYLYYVDHRRPGRIAAAKHDARSDELQILTGNLEDIEAVLARCRIHREACQIALQNNLPKKVLEDIKSRSPVLLSKPKNLSAKDKAEIARNLADLEGQETPITPAGKKRKTRK
jgi:hypothetical protein